MSDPWPYDTGSSDQQRGDRGRRPPYNNSRGGYQRSNDGYRGNQRNQSNDSWNGNSQADDGYGGNQRKRPAPSDDSWGLEQQSGDSHRDDQRKRPARSNDDWGEAPQSNSGDRREQRESRTDDWNSNQVTNGEANGDQEERPAPFKPDELDLEEETKLQVDTVGENFRRYQEQNVTCLPKDLITPINSFDEVIESKLLLNNLKALHYSEMTPIQKWAMPAIVQGYDLIGCAQTGSGKTAAFLLPILQKLMSMDLETNQDAECQNPYCLIISPTRELTKQIYTHAQMLSRDSIIKSCFIYGQIATGHLRASLSRGCHILVSTLGRLKDFTERGWIGFKNIKFIVLDEGDRLIEDGFSADIKAILNHPTMPVKNERQLLFFSATFKTDQQKSAKEYLGKRFVFLTVGRVGAANEDIKQEFLEVERSQKKNELKRILQTVPETDKTIIFTSTKATADILAGFFSALKLSATSIHGDRHQSQREQAISSFRKGEKRFLISSPVGNRGLDLPKVALVINYDLPDNIDEYVHRIGRTGRAGHTGRAISFFDKDRNMDILEDLKKILKEAKQEIPSWMESIGEGYSAGPPRGPSNEDVDDWLGSTNEAPPEQVTAPDQETAPDQGAAAGQEAAPEQGENESNQVEYPERPPSPDFGDAEWI